MSELQERNDNKLMEIIVEDFSYAIKETIDHGRLIFIIDISINGSPPEKLFSGESRDFCFSPMDFYATLNEIDEMDANKTHRYFIFSCACGIPECAGWEKGIFVNVEGESIIWSIDEKIATPIKLIFNKDKYKELCQRMYDDIQRLSRKKPNILPVRGPGDIQYFLKLLDQRYFSEMTD